ncbi:MAG: sulfotransferase family protein [Nitrospirales bacterium]|nr:sulfotransferase family protein [Nitrospirales bacterium]
MPKVACTRVKQTLQEFEGYPVPEDLAELHNRPDRSKQWVPSLSDLSVDEYRAALDSAEWFRFSFVRNPYTRLFSAYKNKIRFLGDPDPVFGYVRDEIFRAYRYPPRSGKQAGVVAFRDFVRFVCEAPGNRMDAHWAPQTQLLRLDLIKYDFIGRFENFQSDLTQILGRLSASQEIKERAQIKVNQTSQNYPTPPFDRETASWVYDVYRDDFVNFGYDRESWLFDDEP